VNFRRIVLCGRSQSFISIDVTLANELSSIWFNLAPVSHLVWRTCVSDPDTFLRLAHLYASQWIPVHILCRAYIDEIDVFSACSCGTERCHRRKIVRNVKKADGRNYALKDPNLADIKLSCLFGARVVESCLDHIPIAFGNRGDDADMRQLAPWALPRRSMHLEMVCECLGAYFFSTTPTVCGFRVSAPEIV
jgi:hypothetical protein